MARQQLAWFLGLTAVLAGWPAAVRAAPSARLTAADAEPDRAPAIQEALDAAEAKGGGVVELGPGVFPIRRALRLPSRVTLRGAGQKRTTVRLVALDTRAPQPPEQCPPSTPRPAIPAAAIYNGANAIMRVQPRYLPATGTCTDAVDPHPLPVDRDVGLAGFTLDCNSRALWTAGVQAAGNGNMGCIELDAIDGLRIDDLLVTDAAMDGVELGWSDGVENFHIRRTRIENSQRFGIGWIAAARGLIADTVLDGNMAGGIDLEPIGRFGSQGAAHDVTLRNVHVSGLRGRPGENLPRDYGVILCFSKVGVTRAIHLERVTIEDVRGVGVLLAWGGDYDDVTMDLDVRRAEVGGLGSSASGRGAASVRGRMIDAGMGPGILGSPMGLSGHEVGWHIGPLQVEQGPGWANSTVLVVPPGTRDSRVHDLRATIHCDPGAAGCRATQLIGGRRTDDRLDASVKVERCKMHNAGL